MLWEDENYIDINTKDEVTPALMTLLRELVDSHLVLERLMNDQDLNLVSYP